MLNALTSRSRRSQRGLTLVEFVTSAFISTVIAGLGITGIIMAVQAVVNITDRSDTMADLQDASTMLIRDVNDAVRLDVTAADELAMEVIRVDTCQYRHWEVVDGTDLAVTTTTYEEDGCAGPGTEGQRTVLRGLSHTDLFTYFQLHPADEPMDQPVLPGDVARVSWGLEADLRTGKTLTVDSGEAFSGPSRVTYGQGQGQQARTPDLWVATEENSDADEGVDYPVLRWNDFSDEGLTQSWTLYRVHGLEGDHGQEGSWHALSTMDANVRSFTDDSLPKGHTAQYAVRATLVDGRGGPTSNLVSTGRRPAEPEGLEAQGQPTSIDLSWEAADGADAYDIYRTTLTDGDDGLELYDSTTSTTWTDDLDYGHSHNYAVVSVNRWERLATTESQSGQVSTGASLDHTYGHTDFNRNASEIDGAFTAPARPKGGAQETSGTNWRNTVTHEAADWVGNGPTSGRVLDWQIQGAEGNDASSGFSVIHTGLTGGSHTDAVANWHSDHQGAYATYQVRTRNSIGTSPWSQSDTALQRPPAPSCTAATRGQGTHQMRISVDRPSMESSYRGNPGARGGVAAPGHSVQFGNKTATGVDVSRLRHDRSQSFDVRTRNHSGANSGWSNWASCSNSPSTNELAVSVSASRVSNGSYETTRSIRVQANPTRGTSQSVELGSRSSSGTSNVFDNLDHDTSFTAWARNTDGYNNVSASTSVRTHELLVSVSASRVSSGSYETTRSIRVQANPTRGTGQSVELGSRSSSGTSAVFNNLSHNTSFKAVARNTDGHNNVSADTSISTAQLRVSLGSTSSTTRRINAQMSATNGSSRWFTLNNGSRRDGTSVAWDPLTHGSSYAVRAHNSDGYNSVTSNPRTVSTQVLAAPATPSCQATRDSQYAPTIVRFSSNGNLNRTAVEAGTAGYYSATATATNTDGHNTRTSINSCGIQVEQRPWFSTGVPPGVDSPQCRSYRTRGDVVDLLNSAATGRPPPGYVLGDPISGFSADYGSYVGGSSGEGNLSCVFYRDHYWIDAHTGEQWGNDLRSTLWNMGSGGTT